MDRGYLVPVLPPATAAPGPGLPPRSTCHAPPSLACRAGLTGEAAEDAINRLERAGQLLSLAGTVVLRPGDVAHALNLVRRRSRLF